MLRLKLEPVFKIRVVYKSGYTHDFEVTEFLVHTNAHGKSYEWVSLTKVHPILLGADDIAAVWQIGQRTRINVAKRSPSASTNTQERNQ